MILVDDREGSSELFPVIRQLTPEVITTRMEFGDVAWSGEGPDGKSIVVGVEHKKIDDILKCIVDGRFAGHQLPGLIQSYDRVWLMIQGSYRADRNNGVLQVKYGDRWRDYSRGGRGFMLRDLLHWLTTLEMQAGIRIVRTFDYYESARWLVAAHSWFTNKGWDEHKSLKQFHVPSPQYATFVKPTLIKRIAKELPGVGWQKSDAAAAHFHTPLQMMVADEKEWMKVDGVGKVMASRIVKDIRGQF